MLIQIWLVCMQRHFMLYLLYHLKWQQLLSNRQRYVGSRQWQSQDTLKASVDDWVTGDNNSFIQTYRENGVLK